MPRKLFLPNDVEVDIPDGYVGESMFFAPRRPQTPYTVKQNDLLLVEMSDGSFGWSAPTSFEYNRLFVDLVGDEQRWPLGSKVVSIATPLKFEFDDNCIHSMNGYFSWCATGVGFGQMSFSLNKETGKVEFDTELMSKEATRRALHDLVDYMIDNGVSGDWRDEASYE